jgi:hypothetical protein
MRFKDLSFVLLLCLSAMLPAQDKKPAIVAYSEPALGERGTTRILYWNQAKNTAVGELAISYGRPVWKKDYEDPASFDRVTKGKVWRLGNDYWTVLDTNIPLKIAGRDIAIGLWYLGLHRSEDGATWSLAFIDPAKARSMRLDPFEISRAPVEFKVPMTTEKADELKERLTIVLSARKENIREVTLRIGWGKLQLSAPIQVAVRD